MDFVGVKLAVDVVTRSQSRREEEGTAAAASSETEDNNEGDSSPPRTRRCNTNTRGTPGRVTTGTSSSSRTSPGLGVTSSIVLW